MTTIFSKLAKQASWGSHLGSSSALPATVHIHWKMQAMSHHIEVCGWPLDKKKISFCDMNNCFRKP